MNIVDAYIKFFDGLIIFVSGLSGSGKTTLGMNISADFKIQFINVCKLLVNNYDTKVKLSDGTTVINWDSVDAFDWTQINNAIKKGKKKGIIITGPVFPLDKIKIKPDFHIHIKLSKQHLIKKREMFSKSSNPEHDKLVLNTITLPFYYSSITPDITITIDKFISANQYIEQNLSKDDINHKIYDDAFSFLINQIQAKLQTVDNKLSTPEVSKYKETKAKTGCNPVLPVSNNSAPIANDDDKTFGEDDKYFDDVFENTNTDNGSFNDSSSTDESFRINTRY